MDDAKPPELIYKESCPYCRRIARGIDILDRSDRFTLTPIESERGERLVTETHDELVMAPHLFTDEYVHYGVFPTAKATVAQFIPFV